MVDATWRTATPTNHAPNVPVEDDDDDDAATQYEDVGAWVCKQGGEVTTEAARAKFDKVGNINSALSRAEKEGLICRLRRGVYASPDYAPAPVEAPEVRVVETDEDHRRKGRDEVTYTEPYTGTPFAPPTPAHPELREWLQAGVDAEHITEQQAALLLWRRGA